MITIEREQHVNDMTVTWTFSIIIRHRILMFSWHGPVHAYHPETPDYLRRGYDEGDAERAERLAHGNSR